MNAEMLRGYTDAIILNILNKGDSYGYMVSKKISDKVNNDLEITNATIYLAFKIVILGLDVRIIRLLIKVNNILKIRKKNGKRIKLLWISF